MSIEDLMNIEVISAARRKERVSDVAAAVSVISQEDIARSHYQSIPELLRLAPGVNVEQSGPGSWEVGVRGFAGLWTDNLLVMMDGRSLYSAADSGVFWNSVDYALADIDRIEVVRGPGATLWGANAVNGVINIITKDAKDTQGVLLDSYAGTDGFIDTARYGGKIGDIGYYRVYAKVRSMDDFDQGWGLNPAAHNPVVDGLDGWDQERTGFRIDLQPGDLDKLTLEGDFFNNRQGSYVVHNFFTPPFSKADQSPVNSSGGDFVARWTHTFSADSELTAQLNYDYLANAPRTFFGINEETDAVDLDVQHHFVLGPNEIVWGGEYRYTAVHERDVPGVISWTHPDGNMQMASAFVQDDYTLVPDRFHIIAGTKAEFDSIVPGTVELQPSIRALWTPDEKQTVWASVSRAARTPSYEEDNAAAIMFRAPGTQGAITPNPELPSVHLMAYEAGYRAEPAKNISLDFSAFYNVYDHLREYEPLAPATLPGGITAIDQLIMADVRGQTYGFEAASTWNATDSLSLTGSYSFLDMHTFGGQGGRLSEFVGDPENQVKLQVHYSATKNLALDSQFYWIDRQDFEPPGPPMPAYFKWDASVSWRISSHADITMGVRNILDNRHPEATTGFTAIDEVPRTYFLELQTRF